MYFFFLFGRMIGCMMIDDGGGFLRDYLGVLYVRKEGKELDECIMDKNIW